MKNLYGVEFITEEGNGYNNEALKTIVLILANNKEEAKKKALEEMTLHEMNLDDLWILKEVHTVEDEDMFIKSFNSKKLINIFDNRVRLEVGDKFIINTFICHDEDILDWYSTLKSKVLVAKEVDLDTCGVWVDNCSYRIDLNEIEKVN